MQGPNGKPDATIDCDSMPIILVQDIASLNNPAKQSLSLAGRLESRNMYLTGYREQRIYVSDRYWLTFRDKDLCEAALVCVICAQLLTGRELHKSWESSMSTIAISTATPTALRNSSESLVQLQIKSHISQQPRSTTNNIQATPYHCPQS